MIDAVTDDDGDDDGTVASPASVAAFDATAATAVATDDDCRHPPPSGSCTAACMVEGEHISLAFEEVDSLCVILLLLTNCKSALFIGKLSKSVIIAACTEEEKQQQQNKQNQTKTRIRNKFVRYQTTCEIFFFKSYLVKWALFSM